MLQRSLSKVLLVLAAIVVVLLVTQQNNVETQSESSIVFLSPIEPTATPEHRLSTQALLALEYVSKVHQLPISSLQVANEEPVSYPMSRRQFIDLTIWTLPLAEHREFMIATPTLFGHRLFSTCKLEPHVYFRQLVSSL